MESQRTALNSRQGFTFIEVIVVLGLIAMGAVLVGAIAQQVINIGKRSTQTGAVLELRNMTNSISRNSVDFLNAMRGSPFTEGVFAGCIPDPRVGIDGFRCPAANVDSLGGDQALIDLTENGLYHPVSAPIVNSGGQLVAGTASSPHYTGIDGRPCTESDVTKCPLRATGYFYRSNANPLEDPGSIKFVIKVEQNALGTGATPMRPQYMSIDIGQDWKDLSASISGGCPEGTLKIGYLTNGRPSCINPSYPCAGTQIPIGLDSQKKTICRDLPDCSADRSGAVLNAAGDGLVCANNSPCGENKLFLGYFAGTGEPMCSSSNMRCDGNQVQVGISIANGNMSAECAVLPDCKDANARLVFKDDEFQCTTEAAAISCKDSEVMTGIKKDGTPQCATRAPASVARACPDGHFVAGFKANDDLICLPDNVGGTSGGTTSSTTGTSTVGQANGNYLGTFHDSDGTAFAGGYSPGVIPVDTSKLITVPLDDAEFARGEINTSYLDSVNTLDWHATFSFKRSTGELAYSMSGFHWAKSGSVTVTNAWKVFASDYGEVPYNGSTQAAYPGSPAMKPYRKVEVYFDSTSKNLKLKITPTLYRIDTYQVVVDRFGTSSGTGGSTGTVLSEHKVGIGEPAEKSLGQHKLCFLNQTNGNRICRVGRSPLNDSAAAWVLHTDDVNSSCGAICSD